MDQIPMPSSLAEVENLIVRLYEPNSAAVVSQVQEVLQRLQKSPQGWQIAEALLARPGDNVKFFGALTIIVKLNTESLEDENAASALENLINWLLRSLEDGSGPIVIRKLCSALVTHFVHYSHLWPQCVQHVLYCLDVGHGVAIEDAKGPYPVEQLIQALTPQKSIAALWFATSLAEEGERTDRQSSTKYIELHDRLASNSQDVASLIAHSLAGPHTQRDSVSCLQAWILYGQRISNDRVTSNLRPLLQPVIKCLTVDELFEASVELVTDTLNNWQNFFTPQDYSLLYSLFESEWARGKYQALLQGDFDFDSVQYGLLMAAFGDAQITQLVENPSDKSQQYLAGLVGLLSAHGYAVAEDKIFVPALEFWSQFVENLVDTLYSEPQNPMDWSSPPLSYIMQAVSHCWRKVQYPSLDDWNSWDSTERVGFMDARKDVADFLQSVYTISGRPLISFFVDLTLQALSNLAWAELEAAAFCLGQLSDCVSEGTDCDSILNKVFGSQLFDLLQQGQSVVPVRARQTCLSLIELYSDYFGRHAVYLPAALNLLFSAVGDVGLAGPSSKSIYRLCSSCRSLLTSEMEAFLGQYESLRASQMMDSLVEERIVGAIASIIQAVTEEASRLAALRRLLLLVGTDIDKSLQLKANEVLLDPNDPLVVRSFDVAQRPTAEIMSTEVSAQLAIRALRCLLGIAKGLQSPIESPVDLDAEESTGVSSNIELRQMQEDIMGLLNRLRETFGNNSEALGIICSILRAGFSENEPGPFVFPPEMVTDFLISPWPNRVASAVSTAGIFVSSLYNGGFRSQVPPILGRLLSWAVGLLHQLQDPENDPELSQYGVEFAQRTATRRPDIFMQLQPPSLLEYFLLFTVKMLTGSEPLPKAAAADFWTNFITLSASDGATQAAIDAAMNHLGPIVAHALIQNVGGRASRSELDKLSEPIKKMAAQQLHARQWLETGLYDPSFPSDKVSQEEKALFLKKVISLRGARATNQLVREFWLACRGSHFAYAS